MMRRVAIVGSVAAVLVLTSTAGAWALDPSIDINTKLKSANTALGLNNLWIIIGAVLVIFMQAGFALVETGFCRAKHAAHVMSTNFAIFGLGFVGFFIVGFPIMFSGYSYPGYFGFDKPLSPDRLIGFGDWTFLWGRSGFALDRRRVQRPGRGVLPLHGRVHGHDRDHPDRRDGRAVEVEGVRRLGPVLRRPLLPDLRWVDLGRRLAQPARQQHRPRVRLRRLRRLRCGPRDGRHRRPCRCDRARCPDRQVRPRRQAANAGGAQHPDGDARHVHPAVRVVRVQRGVDACRRPTSASPSSR